MNDKNYFDKFTREAKQALVFAQEKATEAHLSYVGTEHILLGILSQENSLGASLLRNFGVTIDSVEMVLKTVGRAAASLHKAKEPTGLSGFAKQVIEDAVKCANKYQHNFVGTEHLLFALVAQDNTAATVILENMKINPNDLKMQLVKVFQGQSNAAPGSPANGMNPLEFFLNGLHGVLAGQNQDFKEGYKHKQGGNQAEGPRSKTPTLDYFTDDLVALARKGKLDPVIGRDKEIKRVISILNRKTKNNPVLVGEPGVGKTAIAEGLALRILEDDVPSVLSDKRILSLSMASVVAGTKYRGEFEERIKGIIDEVASVPNVILFIDELHTVIGAGSAEGSLDAANILKPALSRGLVQVIGATTNDEYRKHIETDSALERRFQKVTVDEPSVEDSLEILKGIRKSLEDHHNLAINDKALEESVKLSKRYLHDRYLPDKAIDVLDEACSLKLVDRKTDKDELKTLQAKLSKIVKKKEQSVSNQDYEKAAELRSKELEASKAIEEYKRAKTPRSQREKITEKDIAHVISVMTGVPATKLLKEDMEKLRKLESVLQTRIVGQEEAVVQVAKAIRRSRTGIASQKRPIASFLFMGPTGVGKTELVRALAQEIYNDEDALIKIDMSEFMERHNASRLVGATAGYVGYEDGGQLTESVRRKPYSIILFDELEKAHSDVFNLLLQILEDGTLTDSKGRKVDFKNTIIVMTSNIGAERLTESAGPIGFDLSSTEKERAKKDFEAAKQDIMEDLKHRVSPEFLNRIDKVIVFDALEHEHIREIVKLQIADLEERLAELQLKIKLTDGALNLLAKLSYDPAYGARPARRVIREHIEDPVTDLILAHKIKSGDSIAVKKEKDSLKVEPA
jgi:ATP-dependent Clp protease ATP-binding subunit ClpC